MKVFKKKEISDEVKLNFIKDYILQTRKEIDTEKKEYIRILHLKIIVVGVILAFSKGNLGILIITSLPFIIIALDYLQQSRLNYILHRWNYMNDHLIPSLKSLMIIKGKHLTFFEENVIERNRKKYYVNLESFVRTILVVPSIIASSIAVMVSFSKYTSIATPFNYLLGISWLTIIVLISAKSNKVYNLFYLLTFRRSKICIYNKKDSEHLLLLLPLFHQRPIINANQ